MLFRYHYFLFAYQVVGLIKDVIKKRALKKDKQKENNEEVNKE